MTRKVHLVATGMVTFTPGSVPDPATVPEVTFLMMDNPTRRTAYNDRRKTIVKHVGFLLAPVGNIVQGTSSNRPIEIVNGRGYAGFLLDKERLTLDNDPNTEVSFDSSLADIADLRVLNPDGLMDPAFATDDPPDLNPLAAQLVIRSGRASAGGRGSEVEFRLPNEPATSRITMYNEVHVEFETNAQAFSIEATALKTRDPLPRIRLQFAQQQDEMTIYFGSAPPAAIQQIPGGTTAVTHSQDYDFELFYDITRGGPPKRQPIPNHPAGGPVPGSERCPPLQNGG